jgi:hypothetical protein
MEAAEALRRSQEWQSKEESRMQQKAVSKMDTRVHSRLADRFFSKLKSKKKHESSKVAWAAIRPKFAKLHHQVTPFGLPTDPLDHLLTPK